MNFFFLLFNIQFNSLFRIINMQLRKNTQFRIIDNQENINNPNQVIKQQRESKQIKVENQSIINSAETSKLAQNQTRITSYLPYQPQILNSINDINISKKSIMDINSQMMRKLEQINQIIVNFSPQPESNLQEQTYNNYFYRLGQIFSKSEALSQGINLSSSLLPNPKCLGCIRFFYQNFPYNCQSTEQKFKIIEAKEANSKPLKTNILNLIQNSRESYLFISQTKSTQDGIIFLGYDTNYSIEEFATKIKSQIQQLTYQIGQKIITMNNFEFSIIPIFNKAVFQELLEENLRDHYLGNFVVRIKYNPFDSLKNRKKRVESQNTQRKMSIKRGSHWPVECQKPLKLKFLPSLKKNTVQILQQPQSIEISECKTIIVKLRSTSDDHFMNKIKDSIGSVQLKIVKPYLKYRSKKQNYQSMWMIHHKCSYHTIITHFKQITKLEDIIFAPPQLNLMIIDEYFFTSKGYDLFKKQFESLTSSNYIIFNVKKGMRFYNTITVPIYLVFEHISLAILAMTILIDIGTRRVQFVLRDEITDEVRSDGEAKKKKKVERTKKSKQN